MLDSHPFDMQWQGETQEFCPNAKVVLVGCKLDMRTDLNVMRELAKHRLIPVTHEQVSGVSFSVTVAVCGPPLQQSFLMRETSFFV